MATSIMQSLFLQDHCSKFLINDTNIDSFPEWGHVAISYPDQGMSLGGGSSSTDTPRAHPTSALTPTQLKKTYNLKQ